VIAFISDIHSNTEALSVVLDDIKSRRIRDVVCLGDVIGYGPEPRECLRKVMELCRLTLLGNHEHGAMYYATDFNPKARAAIEWTKERLNSREFPREQNFELWSYIGEMPETHAEDGILLVHGSPRDPVKEYLLPKDAQDAKKMSECFAKMAGGVCFVGHSHVPGVYVEDEGYLSPSQIDGTFRLAGTKKAIVNIGSVGQPRDGDPRASYVIFDDGRVEFRRLPYDHARTMSKIRAIPALPEYLAERLAVGR
jgi:diadenosine tetraphosphatase ApaH/serine/threonine PP2A family protein phosphatase